MKSHSTVFIWPILASQTASTVLLNLIIPSYNLFQEFPKCLPCTSFLLFNKKIVVTFQLLKRNIIHFYDRTWRSKILGHWVSSSLSTYSVMSKVLVLPLKEWLLWNWALLGYVYRSITNQMRVFIPGCPKEEIANKHFHLNFPIIPINY